MARAGRPKFEITPAVIRKTEKFASQGLSLTQIALMLGIATSTLCEKKKEYAELSEAIKRGQASGIAQVSNMLFEKAIEGDNVSIIFYLKNRDPDNWQELQKRELYGKDGGPLQINISDKDALV